MSVPSFTTTCVRKKLIAPQVYELRLRKPDDFRFRPGQFVLFDVPHPTDPSDVQPRAYSIASTPSESDLHFVIKLVPGGRASRWIEECVVVGTPFRLQGPFGRFTLDRDTAKAYLFVGTGTGVAPFRSQVRWSLQEEGDRRSMHLLIGVVQKRDLFWENEWQALEEAYANLHVHASFLSGEADWHGEVGTIADRLLPLLQHANQVSVYICGAPDLVASVRRECLERYGVPRVDVHVESYF